jgi:Flp pilus assembly protein TadD/transglutaminase-like putative cysteine protease
VYSCTRLFSRNYKGLLVLLLAFPILLQASEVWDGPAFSASPAALQQAAALVKGDKDANATILLQERLYTYDREGKAVATYHTIYRVENEEGVSGWAETSAQWEPWHQSKPEIRARVIAVDGVIHTLDLKTLNDVPIHENSPDTYSDQRALGGPLPAIAVGAIVEEEITIRDTAPFFAAGSVERELLNKSVPVNKTRLVVSHPDSLPLHYLLEQMPGARVKKSRHDGIEIIEIEDGPYEARSEKLTNLPSDVPRGPQVEFSTGTSWQQVNAEYARLSNDKLRVADVQSLIGKINPESSSRMELIRRLVATLHKNVRYTGVEFGEASIVPQFPSETLKRKYGDCKDKAALLVTMLRAVKIPANLALLLTGPGQDINPELPGMGRFDHAIVFVPASGSEPELWIDATAQYARVGDLPDTDYGRLALVVGEQNSSLKKIPEIAAAQNFHRELREFTLAEFGPAGIRETDEQVGPREAEFRAFYNGDTKQVREGSEKYVKNAYLADSLIALEHGDLSDMEKPFSLTFVTKGKRGTTNYESAVMAIRVEDLMDGLPAYFTISAAEEKKSEAEDVSQQKRKPRTADWQIDPFINEWDYKITAPPGFKLRALPPSRDEQLGTAKFTQKYSSNADGTVAQAVLRFESGKSRLNVMEAAELRDAVVKARAADPVFVTFDQVAHSLMAAGRIKEGLAEYQQLARQHPKEALHRIQLARALLSAGLAEKARSMAREATSLEPNSAQANSTLAWILEHDLIGRRLKKGYDLQGAVTAYRKAKDLDPKDKDIRANLAMLLEYDSNGDRYTSNAHLKEAVSEFTDLKKMDEETGRTYDDFVLYDLWYAKDFKALEEALKALPATDTRRGFVIAVIATGQGSDAAFKKSLEITTSDELRRKALTTAGWLLLRSHNYDQAADLLTAGARGESAETQTAAFAATLKKAIPREKLKIDDTVPPSALQRFFAATFSSQEDYQQMRKLMSKNALRSRDGKNDAQEFHRAMFQLRVQIEKNGVPFETVGDIVLNNARYSLEGNDAQGYRVTSETPGAAGQQAFVVKENGTYKVLEFGLGADKPPENLGWQALELLKKNDLPGARQWLDWAREKIHMGGNDDPLSVQPFPYFWTKGQEGDAEAIRTAALVLVPSKELQGDDLQALLQARERAKTEPEKSRLDVVAASAYAKQERWAELAPVATRLMQAFPDSLVAFQWMTSVYAHTLRFDDWDKLVVDRLSKHRDELDYTRSEAQLARYRGDFIKSRQVMKELTERSRATQSDLNAFAWDALFLPGEIKPDTIEAAERANQLSQNSDYSIMHTLACLYANAGKAAQARELLLKAMDGKLDEPDSSAWLAYGQIAEAYGEPDAAQAMYARVDKGESESPISNFVLAQQRLLALKRSPATSAKNAGR